jgi:hypothetical protein
MILLQFDSLIKVSGLREPSLEDLTATDWLFETVAMQ